MHKRVTPKRGGMAHAKGAAAMVPEAEEARAALAEGTKVASLRHGGLDIQILQHGSDLWTVLRRGRGGGMTLRTPLFVAGARVAEIETGAHGIALTATNALGRFEVTFDGEPTGLEHFHLRVRFTPEQSVHLPHFPRDLILFGKGSQPSTAEGHVEARQRGLNTALVYFSLGEPRFGKVLYVQDLTELNPYFAATGTVPNGAAGGEWPVLGYRAPTQPNDPSKALPAGRATVLYDTHLVIRSNPEFSETESAWQFLDMLGSVRRRLKGPRTERRDWPGRALATLRDLAHSPKARLHDRGALYFHPYVTAEYPDSMVQLSLLSAVHEWGEWCGRRHPIEAEIRRGLHAFHDEKLRTMRRYLPSVEADKNADAVDSWYLYHPMLNLSNLALAGDETAKDLFLKSVDYGIRAARHFDYAWPIMFDVTDFSVITAVAPADNRGQTDVGGIYAWVMLQAFELTGEVRFLKEAEAALEAARGMRFALNYQANLTAWGAAACIRMWRITGRKSYLTLSYVYLASFFHNAQLWESEIGHARHYSNFLGVTCLQDAPYMALYECFDSFSAFERFLDLGGPDLIPAARMLVADYCRYALHRAWFYYPDALPKEALAKEQRNGEIDPALSFPVEDLYADGQPAGQVGQEIYGGGAAMVFATRAFRRVEGAPFLLFCDHFMRAITRFDTRTLSLRLDGDDNGLAEFAVVRDGRKALPAVVVRTLEGKVVKPAREEAGAICFEVPAYAGLVISWT